MLDKQNSSLDADQSPLSRNEESAREKREPPGSYYYDDATGYEIYKDEKDADEEAEDPEEVD